MKKDYTKHYQIKLSEAGADGRIKLQSLFDILLDAAASHSTSVGMSAVDLLGQGKTWVVSRYNLVIEKYPIWNQNISVTTWRAGEKGKYAIREFLVYDDLQKILLKGTSAWLLIDLKNGGFLEPRAVFSDYPWKDERAIEDDFTELKKVQNETFIKHFNVRLHDIDMNNHVNNSVYPSLAYETGADYFNNKRRLSSIEILFRRESVYGDTLESVIDHTDENTLIHEIRNKKTHDLTALLKTKWQ